jgi:hypothetical protein
VYWRCWSVLYFEVSLPQMGKKCNLHDEDVAEDNGGVDEISITFNGLEGQSRGDFRGTATGEEVVAAFGMVVFGQVAAGWEWSA